MDSSSKTKTHFLSSLLVFKNTNHRELIRSLHLYRSANGNENEVEREFVFNSNGAYIETELAQPVLSLKTLDSHSQGIVYGFWVCVFAFHSSHPPTHFPSFLHLSRNPKLKSIPSLANDLQAVLDSVRVTDEQEKQSDEACVRETSPTLDQDLNSIPYSLTNSDASASDGQQIEKNTSGTAEKKKKRAASKDIANIALSDLAKYFDLPIVEASRKLKVGVTALKRKCREFGIPRWPHRKIKSLDSLIRDLQEARKLEEGNKADETAVAKRQKMLEREKESIANKPFLEMKSETKRFRQDVFKRRHRARVLSSITQQATSTSSSSSSSISGN